MEEHISNRKILIVDDEPLIRWSLQEALQGWGYEPIVAANASEAQERFIQFEPIAVLLDVNLPDSSGLDLLRAFKQQKPETVIIIVTGEVIVENIVAALRGGANDFIGKPINFPELEFALREGLARHPAEQVKPKTQTPQLLIVTDSEPHRQNLVNAFNATGIKITLANSIEECAEACREKHDIAIIDIPPAQLKAVLQQLRASATHANIPLLVDIGRISSDRSLAGVLPQFRAMPCNPHEMVTLARRRIMALSEH
jgi:DNA-binding response OmpR family regulator